MNSILLALLAITALTAVTLTFVHKTPVQNLTKSHEIPAEVKEAFDKWSAEYGKNYLDQTEANYRLGVFYTNYKYVNEHQHRDYQLGYTEFMDLTRAEFASIYLGFRGRKSHSGEVYVAKTDVPTSVDWRTKGAVSAVKNQGSCGSCWAFSTTGSLESEAAIHGTGLGDFSEQQLVDCSTAQGNQGCNGGLMDDAFAYVIAKGIDTEDDYPYVGMDQDCAKDGGAFKISKFTDINKKDCTGLQSAVAQQPVSVAVDAGLAWQFYIGGVLPSWACGKQLDHGVLAVGYDEKGNWIVKNSWGKTWGMKGYIKLKKGDTCGICDAASFPSI